MRAGLYLLTCLLLSLAVACGRSSTERNAQPQLDVAESRRVLAHYAELALAIYQDSLTAAEALQERVDQLVAEPSQQTMQAARQAWLAARVPYTQSEVFRFYDGPIDALEPAINSWPIDENFVESAPDDGTLGIVQDRQRYPQLTAQLIEQLNTRDGETSISLGFHVIEYLLWGADHHLDGPGQRSFSDYVKSGDPKTAELQRRRGDYLRLATQLLVQHVREVRDAWRDQPHTYRARFQAAPVDRSLYWVLKGVAKLSGPELAGERLTVAYETKDQEHEHSCFSDSTHADLLGNARGIENVCLGRYQRLDGQLLTGKGLCGLLQQAAPQLAQQFQQQVRESVARMSAIPAPFDKAILGTDDAPSRRAIAKVIRSLQTQAELAEKLRQQLSLHEQVEVSRQP